jgi:hypothetical protein
MVRSVRHVPNREGLLPLVAAVVLLVGCDFGSGDPRKPTYEVAGNPSVRTTVLSGASASSPSAEEGSKQALSLTPVVQVRPPTVKSTRTQAGHVSYDSETERLHVAYKLSGDSFGGGIDEVDVQPGTTATELVNGRRSLRSTNVDIVAVRYEAGEDALYAAGAVTTEKRRSSPAVVSKIGLGGTEVQAQSKRLSDNVAKGVLLGAAPNSVYVPTDENDIHRFDLDLENQSTRSAGNAAGFRSAVAHDGKLFVLDASGRLFDTDASAFDPLSEVVRLTDSDFGNGTVARLHAAGDRLYAPLNEKGFALAAPTGESAWTSAPVPFQSRYTAMTTGADYLYVGRFDGRVEVYRRPDSIPEQGPEQVGTFGPWDSRFGGTLSGAPINHLLVLDEHLYVANSRDGLVVARIDKE